VRPGHQGGYTIDGKSRVSTSAGRRLPGSVHIGGDGVPREHWAVKRDRSWKSRRFGRPARDNSSARSHRSAVMTEGCGPQSIIRPCAPRPFPMTEGCAHSNHPPCGGKVRFPDCAFAAYGPPRTPGLETGAHLAVVSKPECPSKSPRSPVRGRRPARRSGAHSPRNCAVHYPMPGAPPAAPRGRAPDRGPEARGDEGPARRRLRTARRLSGPVDGADRGAPVIPGVASADAEALPGAGQVCVSPGKNGVVEVGAP